MPDVTRTAPKFITVRDAAALLGVCERTVWRWVSLGDFAQPIRFGGCTRFDEDEVLRWARRPCDQSA